MKKTLTYYVFGLLLFKQIVNAVEDRPQDVCDICLCTNQTIDCRNVKLQASLDASSWAKITNGSEYREARFDNNNIGHVTEFPTLPLTRLSLRCNRIVKIDDMAFRNLTQLEELNLSGNELTTDNLTPKVFQGFYNALNYESMENLKMLDLSENELHTLHGDLFEHLPNVERLYLRENPLEVLTATTVYAIVSLLKLKVLDLSYTKIKALPVGFLHNSQNLLELNLIGNYLTEVPGDVLVEAKQLTILSLNDNPIKVLSWQRPFPPMPSLKQLHLSFMPNLVRIEDGSLSQLTNLEYLDCSMNAQLVSIGPQALLTNGTERVWPPITTLRLNDNALRYLEFDLLGPRWEHMKHIEINGNHWSCDCDNDWMVYTLMPLLKLTRSPYTSVLCASPPPMAGRQLWSLYNKNHTMRCLDYYDHHPENDAAILVSIFVVIILLMVIVGILFWRRNGFPYCRQGGAVNYSRAFYKPTEGDDYEPDKF